MKLRMIELPSGRWYGLPTDEEMAQYQALAAEQQAELQERVKNPLDTGPSIEHARRMNQMRRLEQLWISRV